MAQTAGPTVAAGCEQGDVARERHGTDCLCCHGTSEFGVAGSIDVGETRIAKIVVVDATGWRLEMVPNRHGNFFRDGRTEPPLFAWAIDVRGGEHAMPSPAPHGSCNRCHHAGTLIGELRLR